ncbi:MAG: tRNA lysidine(34) synthetase TilS [Opitutaceae bacterium]
MSTGENRVEWSSVLRSVEERYASVMVPQVETFLKRVRNGRVLVTCSGGADSVFMLLLLVARRNALRIDLVVAHYNHRWRGSASDVDAAFVESLAKAFDLPFAYEARPEHEAAFTETTARALRLQFLRRVATKYECSSVAFGHQMDDILETQLQRIARGSGTDGLAAPRPIARFENLPTHIRPLLNMRAIDIRLALNSLKVPWREDASNEDVSIARNALRRKIIPDMHAALDRDPTVGAARCRRLVEEDAAALNLLAKSTFSGAFAGKRQLQRAELRAAPRALSRRALMAWLNRHELLTSVGALAIDLLLDEIFGAKKKHQVSAGSAFIVIKENTVELLSETEAQVELSKESLSIEIGSSLFLPTGASLDLSFVELDVHLREQIVTGQIDPAEEAYLVASQVDYLTVRGWQAGDRFTPIGAPGTKKLKDWFIDRHIPKSERKRLPVVINSTGEIIWVPGFPPANSLKIRRDTKRALRLTYSSRNPPSLA